MEQTTLRVTGMSCDGCEANVRESVEPLDGVSSVTANHESDEVRVEHEAATVGTDAITGAIEDAGYDVEA